VAVLFYDDFEGGFHGWTGFVTNYDTANPKTYELANTLANIETTASFSSGPIAAYSGSSVAYSENAYAYVTVPSITTGAYSFIFAHYFEATASSTYPLIVGSLITGSGTPLFNIIQSGYNIKVVRASDAFVIASCTPTNNTWNYYEVVYYPSIGRIDLAFNNTYQGSVTGTGVTGTPGTFKLGALENKL